VLQFKKWLLTENDTRTGARLGLYPSIYDNLGQYPPLYSTPIAADFIYYYDIFYGKKPPKYRSPGIVASDRTELLANKHVWQNFKYTRE
jgi:hypothetical protein